MKNKSREKKIDEMEKNNSSKAELYYNKRMEANRLINEESNRLISWSLSIIGGSVLMILSTSYVHPEGYILYSYCLFVIGWSCLGISIYSGEALTRHYIAGAAANEEDSELIRIISAKVDQIFNHQIKYFLRGITIFALWLVTFLVWFILFKRRT